MSKIHENTYLAVNCRMAVPGGGTVRHERPALSGGRIGRQCLWKRAP